MATTSGSVVGVRLLPQDPSACQAAVTAVQEADCVVFGPGSWFTSVLPHLLVPELAKALVATRARRVVVLNLAAQPGETEGFSPEAHLEVLVGHAPDLTFDVVLADAAWVPDRLALEGTALGLGARVLFVPVARGDGTPRHDPERLAAAYRTILTGEAGRSWP